MSSQMRAFARRFGIVLSITLTPVVLIAAILIAYQGGVLASSHREAPLIAKDAEADNTDTYVFISPENQNNIVFIGNWIPFEGPEGGPYYSEWDDTALYDLYVDNDGDAKADITYTLSSRSVVANPLTFLYNTARIDNITDASWNKRQYITITEQLENGTKSTLVNNQLTAPVNIGSKSTPNYAKLESQAIYTITTAQGAGKVFAGQTDDPFWVDLQVFDLLTLRGQAPTVGYSTGTNIAVDSLSGFNVHSLVIEVPISHVTQGAETVIGMWSGTRRPAQRVLLGPNGLGGQTNTMTLTQVSRLGMPLVNEVVIPLALKDAFNSIPPSADLPIYTGLLGTDVANLLQKSVEDPELGTLLCTLYGVPLPNAVNPASSDPAQKCHTKMTPGTPRSGRGDIFDIFLTGFKLAKPFTITTKTGVKTLLAGANVNQPAGVVPAEMLRINTEFRGDTCSPTPSRLGILGHDACGFPNGRRLGDEIVEIELAAVAGAAYQVIDGRDASFTFNAALLGVLNDGIDRNDIPFRKTFPYLAAAQSGQQHWHTNPFFNLLLPWIQKQ